MLNYLPPGNDPPAFRPLQPWRRGAARQPAGAVLGPARHRRRRARAGGCRRAGRALLRQHRRDPRRSRAGADGHRAHQRLCHRPRASAALHGRARPAVRRSGAGLDADDRLRLRPAGIQGRGRGRSRRGRRRGDATSSRADQDALAGATTAPPNTPTIDPEATIAVLPLAAIEQHGPHLPVSTDTSIMEGMLDDGDRRACPTTSTSASCRSRRSASRTSICMRRAR